MALENAQKIKLLKLQEILWTETDADHPISTAALQKKMKDLNMPANCHTVSTDIQTLVDYGYPVMTCQLGHGKGYYVKDRSFSVPEIKILIDAVQAANFIPEEQSATLIGKITELAGTHKAAVLRDNIIRFNVVKHTNEQIYTSIGALEYAVSLEHRVSFRYFDLDENHRRAFRKDGERYCVEPLALVYNDDRYYLMAVSKDHGNTTYRVDRMYDVRMEPDRITGKALAARAQIPEQTARIFRMYSGEPVTVTIAFLRPCMNSVYDRFGENVKIRKGRNDTFVIRVPVQVSPTFFSWLFQFAGQMWILSPQPVQDAYEEHCRKASAPPPGSGSGSHTEGARSEK